MTARAARIVAVAVEVECPYCGESLPNPDNGAFSWRPSEVEDNQGERECNSCDQRFKVLVQSKVSVSYDGWEAP